MANLELVGALDQLERERGIDKEALLSAIEAALVAAYRRNFGSAQNVKVEVDRTSGSIKVLAVKTVVESVQDTSQEISLEKAVEINPEAQASDEIEVEVTPTDFGRIATQTAKQVVLQRIREAERGVIYDQFVNRQGEIVTGTVRRVQARTAYVDLGRTEGVLPPSEQIPREYYRHGERIRVYILEVKKTTKGPQVILSRSHPGLVRRLFELEVPEVFDGTVEIRDVAREAGARTKIAVSSRDENVDAVGSCVGHRGMRVQAVVNELRGERIDVIHWSRDSEEYVRNALSPAKAVSVVVDEDEGAAEVVVPDNQLSLAIGREGQNARLAAKLTGFRIDIKSESQYEQDSDVVEFEAQAPSGEDSLEP